MSYTWHLLGTLRRCGRSSPQSQYSVHFPFRDCPLSPYRETWSEPKLSGPQLFCFLRNRNYRQENRIFLTPLTKHRVLLGCADVNGSFQLFFAVVFKVHELRLPQDEPAHLPVAPGQGGHPSSFLVKPAGFEGVLLGPKPHEGLILEHAPAATPWDHQATWKQERCREQREKQRILLDDTYIDM